MAEPAPEPGPTGPPPADAAAVTPDGAVRKLVLAPGAGAPPPLHSRCIVHYTAYLASSGALFLRSADEGRPGEPGVVVAGRDASLTGAGLNLGVAAMAKGEKARLWVAPSRGYGPRGSFSFPAVPPDAHLIYDVELVDFDPPTEGRPVGGMLFEERVEAAARRRADGNAALGAGDAAGALAKYALSLSYIDDDFLFQLEGRHLAAATAVAAAARLNSAAARLAIGDPRGAAVDATAVLKDDPGNVKALYRRGRARRALGDARGAVADLRAAAGAGGAGDAGVRKELRAAVADLRAQEAAGDGVLRAGFARGTATRKAAAAALELSGPPPLGPVPGWALAGAVAALLGALLALRWAGGSV